MADLTLYDVLGIEPGADDQTVRRAFRAQQRATHPDTTGQSSHVQYDLVTKAGQTLTDPAKRATAVAEVDAYIHNNFLDLNLMTVPGLYGVNNRVSGWKPSPFEVFSFVSAAVK